MSDVNSNLAYEYVRKRILDGYFAPGDPLMTIDLAKKIGVSRTPIRDALRQLEADGLVEIRPRRGASVKCMEFSDFCELCGIRLALESYAAGFAARNRTATDLREISAALENMRRLTARIARSDREQPLIGDLVQEDVRFHIAIIAAAKNNLLKKEILRLHVVNRVILGPGSADPRNLLTKRERDERREIVMKSHDDIYDAIERGDPSAARHAMEAHIQELIEHSQQVLARAETASVRQLTVRPLTEEERHYSA